MIQHRRANTDTLFETSTLGSSESADVSVIITLYDLADYITDCLNSVHAQTIPSLELIVIDDCSKDKRCCTVVLEWMTEHFARFDRCILLRHRRNQGVSQARNSAFRFTSAEYVFVLDADNEIMPRCIERLHSVLHGSEHGAAYSQLEIFGEISGIGYADIWDPEALKSGNYIDVMSLISRWAWDAVGGYTHIEGGWEDYDLWCKFVEENISAIFIPEILSRYRVRPDSMLRTETNAKMESIRCAMTFRHPWLEI